MIYSNEVKLEQTLINLIWYLEIGICTSVCKNTPKPLFEYYSNIHPEPASTAYTQNNTSTIMKITLNQN